VILHDLATIGDPDFVYCRGLWNFDARVFVGSKGNLNLAAEYLIYSNAAEVPMVYAEWTIFAFAVIWTICTNIALRAHYASSDQPSLPANATAMAQLASVVIVTIYGYSPLHLIWLLPVSYLAGFFALRVRIVGRVAWLYGYLIAYTVPANW
jgi:hypothetical protein